MHVNVQKVQIMTHWNRFVFVNIRHNYLQKMDVFVHKTLCSIVQTLYNQHAQNACVFVIKKIKLLLMVIVNAHLTQHTTVTYKLVNVITTLKLLSMEHVLVQKAKLLMGIIVFAQTMQMIKIMKEFAHVMQMIRYF